MAVLYVATKKKITRQLRHNNSLCNKLHLNLEIDKLIATERTSNLNSNLRGSMFVRPSFASCMSEICSWLVVSNSARDLVSFFRIPQNMITHKQFNKLASERRKAWINVCSDLLLLLSMSVFKYPIRPVNFRESHFDCSPSRDIQKSDWLAMTYKQPVPSLCLLLIKFSLESNEAKYIFYRHLFSCVSTVRRQSAKTARYLSLCGRICDCVFVSNQAQRSRI
ncbi:hypothetical protein NQ317_004211 [Molorchus minor]|uniref:Uncharacterized protein n=1 Tax=Molorchus minor TaxID=1323400 RepID=A0ABQ9JLI9_9CUCU|nr:hypothetical protein NQ317_004211 [Molorchus minor]